jgi:flagellar hook assembly protein FlgD
VDLSIYNILGQKVTTLVNKNQPAGMYQVEWDASEVSSGVYYYRLEAEEFCDVKKMVVIK